MNNTPVDIETLIAENARLKRKVQRLETWKRLAGPYTDITQRRHIERALRDSERTLLASQKIAGLGSYTLNIRAGMFKTSPVMDDLLGIDANYDHSIQGWANLLHPDDRAPVLDYLQHEVIAKARPFDREFRIVRFDNRKIRWLHALGDMECDAQGQPVTLYGTSQDITERRRIEAELQEYRHHLENLVTQRTAELGGQASR